MAKHARPRSRRFRFTAGLIVGSVVMLGATAATAATGAFSSGSFTLACNASAAGALSCSGNLPKATTTTVPSTTMTTVPATTTTTVPPTTTTTTAPAGNACTSTESYPNGTSGGTSCDFAENPVITGSGIGSNPYVDPNLWGPVPGTSETVTAHSPTNWSTSYTAPSGNTAVTGFANTGVLAKGTVDGPTSTVSSFTESTPHNAQTSAWSMYDLWYNNWNDEVMIQYDFTNNGDCTVVPGSVTQFGGSNGVPVQTWHLCDFTSPGDSGSTVAWKLGSGEGSAKVSESTGSIDLRAMSQWLETHSHTAGHGTGTYLPAGSAWTAVSQGWEVCSTGGVPETFSESSYTLTFTP